MPLTDLAVRRAKGAEKPYKLHDSSGLHLYVSTAGGRLWRWRYTRHGKEQLLSLGAYPELSLAEAREARDVARRALKSGDDPAAMKREGRVAARKADAETFEVLAREWHELQKPQWTERHASDVLVSLERDAFPDIGSMPIRRVTTPQIVATVRKVETRGSKDTARRLRQRISAVFVHAIATGRGDTDPAAPVKGAMAPIRKGRQPAITDLSLAREMLRKVDATPAYPATKLALRLLAIVAVRPGTLISTPWAELDGLDPDAPTWRIPASRLKLKMAHKGDDARDHLVPLPRQAIEVLSALRQLTGRGPFILPHGRSALKHASENALGYLLNRAGYHHKHVPHGFRSTFSTIMNELHRDDRAVIDFMLAHVPKDGVEAAYNRALYLDRRRELAQIWADLITDGLRPPDELVEMPKRVNVRLHAASP